MSASHELDVFSCALDGVTQIEASAGTGKTWNICALYLRLLLEKRLSAEEILVVTFTKAATADNATADNQVLSKRERADHTRSALSFWEIRSTAAPREFR